MIYEIVILAMIAAFLGLRLYSVLGRRAEHEEEPVPHRFESPRAPDPQHEKQQVQAAADDQVPANALPFVQDGIRDIAAADRTFDITRFVDGAKAAYGMVLEAFWKGDRETLRELCDDDVYASFEGAITAREEAGEVMENRLIRIEEATIRDAVLDGRTARITVRFVSDIAAVTRDSEGNLVAGSLDDAIESRDIWTFARDVNAAGPHWILDETDEG
ncbi:Tim44/TimA family putative adaptor protein [Erythrobacter sp. LQ02-29]|uniref:Tim44/TimA family putative adaptor protein n=1 Tax=Erythrobacter sp. LQ02-29 TaxID=2920384 RepID=UPI001F4EF1EB|nr:Tim44/TimA family putative adaptor protein [Erythrobacter sp. LQ02-29]